MRRVLLAVAAWRAWRAVSAFRFVHAEIEATEVAHCGCDLSDATVVPDSATTCLLCIFVKGRRP